MLCCIPHYVGELQEYSHVGQSDLCIHIIISRVLAMSTITNSVLYSSTLPILSPLQTRPIDSYHIILLMLVYASNCLQWWI